MRRRLDVELIRRGLAHSRRRAADAIAEGRVRVAGAPAHNPARLVADGQPIEVTGPPPPYVSRGGEKLAAALDCFDVEVAGRRALDAGASTGGFADCLLQRGAEHVVAVDVGRGQLAWSLRNDPRVSVLESTNVRTLTADDIGGPADLCTADLSFISLVTCAPALVRCTKPGADLVLLVKPQFEAGRARLGKGGVVRDPAVHQAVLREVRDGLAATDVIVVDAAPSPLRGADGNVEFFFHCRQRGARRTSEVLDNDSLSAVAARATGSER